MRYAPTLTVTVDSNPAPRCLITFSSLATGTQTVTVYRVTEGRTFKVRGGVGLYAVGGCTVMDYEVGLAVSNSYRAEMFNASGVSLGFTDAASVTVDPGFTSVSRVWVSQPLKPALAIQATMMLGSAASIVRKSPGSVYYPEGAYVGSRIGSNRQGISGMAMMLWCDSAADADEFQHMLGGYMSDLPAVLLIRTAPPMRIPRVLFASIDVAEVGFDLASRVELDITLDEVAPPFPGLVTPILRREDLDAAFTTRGAMDAAYATRQQMDTDFSKAGLAGP